MRPRIFGFSFKKRLIAFVSKGNPQLHIFATAHDSTATLDNIKLEELGEVAAYTPRSIGDKWYDETSNNNHGTIAGATSVNPLRLGTPRVLGNLELSTGISGHNILTIGDNDAYGGTIRSDFGLTLSADSNDNNSANYSKLILKTDNTTRIEADSAGAVTATSAASTNLKQVARMHSKTVVVNTGTALAYTVTHNLGTRGIITSAQDSSNEFVDVHVDAATDDTAVFTFANASAVASNENFIFTIMGGGAPEAA